ncbi:MsnO8 family LLM class oxidoreductase [Aeromicrobium sp.]|uniref:MsnO8 family LLM class oxidoreductase n=1 Tax=Aeromicrobium sp. TaxID=1871063 RepID=UPI0019AAEC63|nr:MsnO8 family LLM class oxidoreductase [Aeromicrobium sp.]MBC7630881.1 MsnO8 family LLM class oxidoreductase [Aeromicrobium sp.]
MKLSLLDRSRTRVDRPDAEGLTGSVARAVNAEKLGYDRFWVAEHHAVPGIASGSPPILLAAIGAQTERIRLGSGGVMLPNHQPFVVAEQFLMLEALYPGRIDLGLGRSLGFTAPVRKALRYDSDAPDSFEQDLVSLRGYLDGDATVTARPKASHRIPMFVMATGRGLTTAAKLGMPVVVGGPILADESLGDRLEAYRKDFQPSERAPAPYVAISLDVTVAEDEATARDLALPEAWAMARSRQIGEFPPLESIESIRGQAWSSQTRGRVESSLDRAVLGDASAVRRRLGELADRTDADELIASTSTYDREALLASDDALRQLI